MFYSPVVVVQSVIYHLYLEQCYDLIFTACLSHFMHTNPYVNGFLFILCLNKDPNYIVDLFKFLAGSLIFVAIYMLMCL
jgi:hypothetical protein